MELKQIGQLILGSAVLLLAGYGIGRYLQPAKVEIKKEVVIQEVEVTKKNLVIKEKTVKQADGTVVTEKVTEENTTSSIQKESSQKETSVVTSQKPQWRLRGGGGLDLQNKDLVYMVGLEKRLMGPLSVGLDVDMKKSIDMDRAKLTLSWEF